ncbi:DNA-binding response regulator, OmpR family, contains REC and winged-helix (wHTH) domain [Cryobacterium flavum]|uniref:DNA-binding response regulator, OmpR family, contains REC and winged-helix (WHTH) domain n=1 Tax=Cryobacterium flavum TaxID=1424659 RepID=A0A4R8UXB6_9MICO|nr:MULTISPECIES: response regulator transcription factor [Cryobacterium]TFB72875.1 response regulator transcription factor [Cryobacterium flavum]SDO43309.1 DNA-binding response regulator, OmpR family, contains REC and winged-helix (wHTH) domain [Cryobacterium flavum]
MPAETTVRARLLLIEDDAKLGPMIRDVLTEIYNVTLVADGSDGLAAGLAGEFEVMVIDRRLPTLDGLKVVEAFRRKLVTTPILLLTALGTTSDKVAGLDIGANDYLVKPFEFDELFARLRAIRRVFTGEGRTVLVGGWEYYPDSRTIYSPYDGRILLTVKENELLKLLADAPQRTFSRQQILQAVFSAADTAGTVDTYVHYLRRKTDTDIVLTVRGEGYRLGQP